VSVPDPKGATVKAITAVKPDDGFDLWHNMTCRSYSVTECRNVVDRRFRSHITTRTLGALAISDTAGAMPPDSSISLTRSRVEIRKDPRDYFMLWLMLDGQMGLEQRGHSEIMRAGDLFVYDQSQPFVLEFGPRWRTLFVAIPRPLLTCRLPAAHQLAGRRITANRSLAALAGSLVNRLYHLDDTTRGEIADRISSSALDILAAALEAGVDPAAGATRHERRLDDAKRYILAHLDDPELDLESIARAQDMAPRTLYRLFASEGTPPMRWLWQQRLARSYKALSEGKFMQVTDVALSCGFSDVSHFSRSFKATFGQSPRAFKQRW
jgi:AraC-like DNA-binding protein